MLIENIEKFCDEITFEPKVRVTCVLNVESLMDAAAVLPREELAESFLKEFETAYLEYKLTSKANEEN